MNVQHFYDLIASGKQPIVRFNSLIEEYDDSFDEGMKAKLTSVHKDSVCYVFSCDMNDFLEYNKTVAKPNFYDKQGNPTLTWQETAYFPKNGVEIVYLMPDIEAPFEQIDLHPLYKEFIESNDEGDYAEWLEKMVMMYRNERF